MAEPTGDLCRHLFVGLEALVPEAVDGCWHPPSPIQLQGGIKLPEAEWRLIAGGDETLITAGQRFLHQFAAIGTLHVVPTPGSGQFQSLDDGIRGVYLHRVRVRLPVKVGDQDRVGIAVVVDDGLLTEVRVIVLRIQFQGLVEQGDIE